MAAIALAMAVWVDPKAVNALIGLTVSAVVLTVAYAIARWG